MHKLFIWSPLVGCFLNIVTIVVCYALAAKRNGSAWVLTPSSIGYGEPESIIFTTGFTLAGFFFLKTSIMRHLLLRQTFCYLERENLMLLKRLAELRVINIVATVFGCLGSVFLCLVGLRRFMDSQQDLFIIIVPYGLYVASMWANTRQSYFLRRRKSFFYFFILSLCASFVLVLASILIWFEDHNLRCIGAACEYVLVITVVRFISLHFNDFRNSNFMALDRLDTNINSSPLSRHVTFRFGNNGDTTIA